MKKHILFFSALIMCTCMMGQELNKSFEFEHFDSLSSISFHYNSKTDTLLVNAVVKTYTAELFSGKLGDTDAKSVNIKLKKSCKKYIDSARSTDEEEEEVRLDKAITESVKEAYATRPKEKNVVLDELDDSYFAGIRDTTLFGVTVTLRKKTGIQTYNMRTEAWQLDEINIAKIKEEREAEAVKKEEKALQNLEKAIKEETEALAGAGDASKSAADAAANAAKEPENKNKAKKAKEREIEAKEAEKKANDAKKVVEEAKAIADTATKNKDKIVNRNKENTPSEFQTGSTLDIERVELTFSNYLMGTINVYGTITDAKKNIVQTIFVNRGPLSIASQNSLEAIRRRGWLIDAKTRTKIRIDDVLAFEKNSQGIINEFIPRPQTITLQSVAQKEKVFKHGLTSMINFSMFTDFWGLINSESPNGKLQWDFKMTVPLIVRNGTSPFGNKNVSRYYLTKEKGHFSLFKDFQIWSCLSKVGTDNRAVEVGRQYLVRDSAGVAVDSSLALKYVNHFDVLEHTNFWVGIRANILTVEGKNPSSALYLNYRFRYMRADLRDTSVTNKEPQRTPRIYFIYHEADLMLRNKLRINCMVDIGVSAGFLHQYGNDYMMSINHQKEGDKVSSYKAAEKSNVFSKQIIWTPYMNITYYGNYTILKGVFVRCAFPQSFHTRNGFLTLQVGFSKSIEDVFPSKKEKPKQTDLAGVQK